MRVQISARARTDAGLAILVVSLAFNALGESLRIVLDPTMKDR
jgi:ABC-type dipeptide/oligopeptide/nickel transport system permease subunit